MNVIETEMFVDGKLCPLVVKQHGARYDIIVDGVVRHPNCTTDDLLRGLAHYIYGLSYSLERELNPLDSQVKDRPPDPGPLKPTPPPMQVIRKWGDV